VNDLTQEVARLGATHAQSEVAERKRSALIEAAYHSYLSSLPTAGFVTIKWKREAHKTEVRREQGHGTGSSWVPREFFDPEARGYLASEVDPVMNTIGRLSKPEQLAELLSYLTTLRPLTRASAVWTDECVGDRAPWAYSIDAVEAHLALVRRSLAVYFRSCAEATAGVYGSGTLEIG
jgi:hypothetical protein